MVMTMIAGAHCHATGRNRILTPTWPPLKIILPRKAEKPPCVSCPIIMSDNVVNGG